MFALYGDDPAQGIEHRRLGRRAMVSAVSNEKWGKGMAAPAPRRTCPQTPSTMQEITANRTDLL